MFWLKLGWLEWQRSLFQGKQNRDFFWLIVLLSLTLLLAILLKGTQEGLLDKFVDVSIGHVEGAGIPVWVTANSPLGKRIDRETLDNISTDFKLYPYREVELPEIGLIGSESERKKIWRTKNFIGWAVSIDDPLWQTGMEDQEKSILDFQENQSNMPLVVILNKSLFKKFFDCDTYLNTLHSHYPFLEKIAKENDKLYCLTEDSKLWLKVRIGGKREFLPFYIYWQTHIPTMEEIALLMPITVFNTLGVSNLYLKLGYDPLFPDSKGQRVKQVMEFGESDYLEKIKQQCFPTATINKNSLVLDKAVPEMWFKQCITTLNIPLFDMKGKFPETASYVQIVDAPSSQYSFHYSKKGFLTVSCNNKDACTRCEERIENISDDYIRKVAFCSEEKLQIDVIRAIGGYGDAFTYASNRTLLNQEIERIKDYPPNQTEKHFHIPKTYEDALVRFTFIDKIMVLFKRHYAWLFLVFLTVLLFVQVGIVISHRKHNYGIYLSKGIKLPILYRIVLLQVTLSFLVACLIVTPFIINILQSLLASGVQEIITVKPYVSHISAASLDLLPVPIWNYIVIAFIFLIVLYLTTISLLHWTIAKEYSEPAHLL